MKKLICLIVVLLSINLSAQTVSYSTAADRRARAWEAFNSIQLFLNTQMSFEDGQWAQSDQNFEALSARIAAIEKQSAIAQQVIDAHPCDALGFKFADGAFSFTTAQPCVGWLLGGYNYGATVPNFQATRGTCSTVGTVTGSLDTTPKTSFAWALPSTWPAHGCVIVRTWDSSGNLTAKQFVY